MIKKFDFLVIGSGIAGLNFALQIAKYGQVAIVTKKDLMESNSNYAQGGIAVVLDETDSFKKHITDTMKAGCYLNDRHAVEIMIKHAPKEIKRLLNIGVGFAHIQNHLALGLEGGHSHRRIVHAKDATGREIERALIYQVRHNENIACFESYFAVDLVISNKHCLGAIILDKKNKAKLFLSKATILATGGLGQVYFRNSNPKIATGDGIAIANRAGANIKDMEFIQFHPTALSKKGKPAFLISEALRGEGAILKNKKNDAFMKRYHPLAELAPRDIVARAIFQEIKNGPVYLDIRHKSVEFIKNRFPYIYNELWWYGIMMEKNLIPVAPVAHFSCGGVHTNLNGETNIHGLYAFGEVSHTGVHGANRLASNSLLECLVFSSRTVTAVKKYTKKQKQPDIKITLPKITNLTKKQTTECEKYKKNIQNLMWNHVGIVRKLPKMIETLKQLKNYRQKIDQIKNISKEKIELKNLCQIAILITESAIARSKSIGTHFITK